MYNSLATSSPGRQHQQQQQSTKKSSGNSPTRRSHHSGSKAHGHHHHQSDQQNLTLTKSHKLEGDCLITGFYDFLLLRNNETMKPCVEVRIPDTIVYYHNFPRGWYTTDMSNPAQCEVTKRQGTDLDSANVVKFFKNPPKTQEKNPKALSVVAFYLSINDENDDDITTSVEFFNEKTIKEFVDRKDKREGILQRFVIPKGASRNTVIQAVWSPNDKAFCVWRRTNRMNLSTYDPRHPPQFDKDPYPMCVTYDGPSHYSEEGTCATKVKLQIRDICDRIVEHFFQVYEREKVITRLVLYFKLDENDDPWLLWCGGLRVADASSATTAADPTHRSVPLNLAPRYTDSSAEARRETHELEMLSVANHKYYALRKSAAANNSPNKSGTHGSDSSANNSPNATQRGGGGGSPNSKNISEEEVDAVGDQKNSSVLDSKKGGDEKSRQAGGGGSISSGSGDDSSSNNTEKENWHKNPQIHDQYVQLCTDRDIVINYLEDTFYEAYGHFLKYDPGPYEFDVDKKIATILGNDPLGEAMAAGGVQKATPSETSMNSIDDEDLRFGIPPKHPNGPVSKIGEAVKKWVHSHYDKLIVDLKEEAASMLPPMTSMNTQAKK